MNGLKVEKGMAKLSSGLRINQAGDDASGLAVSEKMRSQIRGLNRANANAQDGISFIQTTEGYLGATTEALQRIRELSIQSSNGIYSSEDRTQIQVEVSQLVAEVDRIASQANFNGVNMLTGRYSRPNGTVTPTASMWFHVGANVNETIDAYIGDMSAKGLGIKNEQFTISVSAPAKANQTISLIDTALRRVNKQRADLGAYQNRLDHVVNSTAINAENLQASESKIRDTNMAQEMSDLVKNQVLNQASIAMLAQANAKTQSVLQLLN